MNTKWIDRLVLIAVIIYALLFVSEIARHKDKYQWDFKIYYSAAELHSKGLNPYNERVLYRVMDRLGGAPGGLWFGYPPLVLLCSKPLLLFEYGTAYILYLIFKISILAVLLILWRTAFLKNESDSYFYLFCLVA